MGEFQIASGKIERGNSDRGLVARLERSESFPQV